MKIKRKVLVEMEFKHKSKVHQVYYLQRNKRLLMCKCLRMYSNLVMSLDKQYLNEKVCIQVIMILKSLNRKLILRQHLLKKILDLNQCKQKDTHLFFQEKTMFLKENNLSHMMKYILRFGDKDLE